MRNLSVIRVNHLFRIITAAALALMVTFAPARAAGSGVGDQFPNIRFVDAEGNSRTLEQFRVKVLVVKFWGSWCTICRAKWPGHQALYEQVRDNPDIEVLTIAFAEGFDAGRDYAASKGYTAPLYHGSRLGIIKTVDGEPFQPLGTPYNLVIDRDGVVRHKWIGNQEGVAVEQIQALL